MPAAWGGSYYLEFDINFFFFICRTVDVLSTCDRCDRSNWFLWQRGSIAVIFFLVLSLVRDEIISSISSFCPRFGLWFVYSIRGYGVGTPNICHCPGSYSFSLRFSKDGWGGIVCATGFNANIFVISCLHVIILVKKDIITAVVRILPNHPQFFSFFFYCLRIMFLILLYQTDTAPGFPQGSQVYLR